MAAQQATEGPQLSNQHASVSISVGASDPADIHHSSRCRTTTHRAASSSTGERKRSRSDIEEIADTFSSIEGDLPAGRRSRHAEQAEEANWCAATEKAQDPTSLQKEDAWVASRQEQKKPGNEVTRENSVDSSGETPVPLLSGHRGDMVSSAAEEDGTGTSVTAGGPVPLQTSNEDASVDVATAADPLVSHAGSQGPGARPSKETGGTSLGWLNMYALSEMLFSELDGATDQQKSMEDAVRDTSDATEDSPTESLPATGLPLNEDSGVRPSEALDDFAGVSSCENYLLDDVRSFVAAKSHLLEDSPPPGSSASASPARDDDFERRESLSSTEASAEKWNWPGTSPQEATDAAWDCLQEQLTWRALRFRSKRSTLAKNSQTYEPSTASEAEAVTPSFPQKLGSMKRSCRAIDSNGDCQRDSRPQATGGAQTQDVTTETSDKVQEDSDDGSFPAVHPESPRAETTDFGGGVSGAVNALFYSVSEGGMNTAKGTSSSMRLYPVVRGVSRDNTKRRWAVYWKGNRKYFYDKFYEDSYQAYLQAVDFRKQAKTAADRPTGDCTAPTSCSSSASVFFSNSSAAPRSGKTSYATPFPPGASTSDHTPSATGDVSAVCSSSESLLSAGLAPSNSSVGDDALHAGSPGEPTGALPTTHSSVRVGVEGKRSLGNSTECATRRRHISPQALELYKSAVRLMLEDLTTIVVPTFIAVARTTMAHSARGNPESMTEGLRAVASLTLLQNLLQWHAQHVQKATHHEALTPFLTVLAPCLEGTQLPSQTTPYQQQCLLLDLLELHVRELLSISRNIYTHFRQEQTEQLFILVQRLIKDRNSSGLLRPNEAVPRPDRT